MTNAETNLDELSQVAQVALMQALQALAGAEAAMQNDHILVNLGAIYVVRARVLDVSDSDDGSIVHLAVQVAGEAAGEPGIFDILAGAERSPHEAILVAIRRWIRFTFPPIRAALSGIEPHDLSVGITQLVVRPDLQWTILLGNPQIIGQPQDAANLQNALKGDTSLFPGIAGDVVGARLNDEERWLHWLKLFVAWADGEKVVECQFDNAPWPELDNFLYENFWFPPLADDFISLTQFVVIVPD